MASAYIAKYSILPYSVQGLTIKDGDSDIGVSTLLGLTSLLSLIITGGEDGGEGEGEGEGGGGGMQYFSFDDIKQICNEHPSLEKIKFCVNCVDEFSDIKSKLISLMLNNNGFITVVEFNEKFNS